MFTNIGSKIKTLAKVLFWISTIGSMIGAFGVIAFAAMSGSDEIIIAILIGVVIVVVGVIVAWLSNFMLYGFGELIDTNQKMLRIMQDQFRPKTNTNVNNNIQPKVESI